METQNVYDPQGRPVRTRMIPHGESKIGKADGVATLAGDNADESDYAGNYIRFEIGGRKTNHYIYIGQNLTALLNGAGELVEDYLNMPGRNAPVGNP